MKLIQLALAAFLTLTSQVSMGQASGTIDADLRHSEICARATNEFRKHPEWKDRPVTFTSHFNKKLGKCLVLVTESDVVSGQVLETRHVFDALEGVVLGGEILTKEIPHNGTQKTLGISMVRGGKLLGKKNIDEAREAYQWFQTLMAE